MDFPIIPMFGIFGIFGIFGFSTFGIFGLFGGGFSKYVHRGWATYICLGHLARLMRIPITQS
jgi:hypothetical protein